MSKDIKKLLDKISGKKVNHLRVTSTEAWSNYRYSLEFDIEIDSANLGEFEGQNYIVIHLMVSNRTINDEVNEEEFEWQFQKPMFQSEFKEALYEKYKIEALGVDLDSLETEYKFL
jgi:hypothetical protein